MAEIRKHNPATGNAIQHALRAAMGEGIRPRVPGEDAPSKPAAPAPGTGATTWVSLQVHQPTPEPEPEDDETAGP
jgi:hypothetical protein